MKTENDLVNEMYAALEPFAEVGIDLTSILCHYGICPPEECPRCQRVLAARAALAKANGQKEQQEAAQEKPCGYCYYVDCQCSDFDVSPDMGAKG